MITLFPGWDITAECPTNEIELTFDILGWQKSERQTSQNKTKHFCMAKQYERIKENVFKLGKPTFKSSPANTNRYVGNLRL